MKRLFVPIVFLLIFSSCEQHQDSDPVSMTDTVRVASSDTSGTDLVKITMTGQLPAQQSIPTLF